MMNSKSGKCVKKTLLRWKKSLTWCVRGRNHHLKKRTTPDGADYDVKPAIDPVHFPDGLHLHRLLSQELLEIVLEQCDFLTQTKLERVCHRWKSSVRNPTFNSFYYMDFDVTVNAGTIVSRRGPSKTCPGYMDEDFGLQQMVDSFVSKRPPLVKTIVLRGINPSRPMMVLDINDLMYGAHPSRLERKINTTIRFLTKNGQCPHLTTLVLSGVRITCTTSGRIIHERGNFLPSTVCRLEFHNVLITVGFPELPQPMFRPFRTKKFAIDFMPDLTGIQRRRQLTKALFNMANQAILETAESDIQSMRTMSPAWSAAVRDALQYPRWTDGPGRDLCRILVFRMDLNPTAQYDVDNYAELQNLVHVSRDKETISLPSAISAITLYALKVFEDYEKTCDPRDRYVRQSLRTEERGSGDCMDCHDDRTRIRQ